MPSPIIALRFPRPPTRCISASLLSLLGSSCTLSDYSYLGAEQPVVARSGGSGGTSKPFSSSPLAGGSANTGGEGDEGVGGVSALAIGATYAINSAEGGTGSPRTTAVATGGTVQTETASVTSGGSATSSAVASGGSVTGGSVASGGSVTGGSVATGGRATGGSVATGGRATGGSATGGAVTCSGCARLDVPFTAKGQLARYYLVFTPTVTVNERSDTTVTSAGTMKIRAHAPRLGNSSYDMLIQQSNGDYTICYSAIQTWPSAITSSWVTLEWSLASCATNENDTAIGRLAIDLIAPADGPTPSNTALWLDKIWIELKGQTIVGPFDFSVAACVNGSAITNDWEQTEDVLFLRPSVPAPQSWPDISIITPPSGSTIGWFSQ